MAQDRLLDVAEPALVQRARRVGRECNEAGQRHRELLAERAQLVEQLRDMGLTAAQVASVLSTSPENVYRVERANRASASARARSA